MIIYTHHVKYDAKVFKTRAHLYKLLRPVFLLCVASIQKIACQNCDRRISFGLKVNRYVSLQHVTQRLQIKQLYNNDKTITSTPSTQHLQVCDSISWLEHQACLKPNYNGFAKLVTHLTHQKCFYLAIVIPPPNCRFSELLCSLIF